MSIEHSNLADAILGFLNEALDADSYEAPLSRTTALLDEALLDSITVFELTAFLEDIVGVPVPFEELVPDNFVTVDAIAAMAIRLAIPNGVNPH